jgi:hypothetical protein
VTVWAVTSQIAGPLHYVSGILKPAICSVSGRSGSNLGESYQGKGNLNTSAGSELRQNECIGCGEPSNLSGPFLWQCSIADHHDFGG